MRETRSMPRPTLPVKVTLLSIGLLAMTAPSCAGHPEAARDDAEVPVAARDDADWGGPDADPGRGEEPGPPGWDALPGDLLSDPEPPSTSDLASDDESPDAAPPSDPGVPDRLDPDLPDDSPGFDDEPADPGDPSLAYDVLRTPDVPDLACTRDADCQVGTTCWVGSCRDGFCRDFQPDPSAHCYDGGDFECNEYWCDAAGNCHRFGLDLNSCSPNNCKDRPVCLGGVCDHNYDPYMGYACADGDPCTYNDYANDFPTCSCVAIVQTDRTCCRADEDCGEGGHCFHSWAIDEAWCGAM
jgi:hypothetical protein